MIINPKHNGLNLIDLLPLQLLQQMLMSLCAHTRDVIAFPVSMHSHFEHSIQRQSHKFSATPESNKLSLLPPMWPVIETYLAFEKVTHPETLYPRSSTSD